MRAFLLAICLALSCASCAAIKADAYDYAESDGPSSDNTWRFYDPEGWGMIGYSEMEEYSGGSPF